MTKKERPCAPTKKNMREAVAQPIGLADAEIKLEEAFSLLGNSKNAKAAELFKKNAAGILAKGDYPFFRDWLQTTSEIFSLPWEVLWNWLVYSPAAQGILTGDALLTWARFCAALSRCNVDACLRVIKSSPEILGEIAGGKRDLLLQCCSKLITVSWPGSLALFEHMPVAARHLKDGEISEWFNEGLILSRLDTRIGEAYFKSGGIWSSSSFDLFNSWVNWGKNISAENIESGIAYFSSVPFIINSLGEQSFKKLLPEWGGWIEKLHRIDPEVAACFAKSGREVIPKLQGTGLGLWAESILTLSEINNKAAVTLLSSSSQVFEELNLYEFLNWFRHVLAETSLKEERLCEAFAIQTRESNKSLVSFRQGVSFEDAAKTLVYFALVLFDREVIIKSSALLPKELTGPAPFASGDGKRIYLPKFINLYPDAEDNFRIYKALLIHEMVHLTEESYQIDEAQMSQLASDFNLADNTAPLNLHAYFSRFENYDLVRDLFELIEDARAEESFLRKYPTLEKELKVAGLQQECGKDGAVDRLAGLMTDLAGLSVRRTGDKSEQLAFFDETLADLIKSGSSAKDSLLLATRWYYHLKNSMASYRTYKSFPHLLHRGKLCPVLLAVSREMEKEYFRISTFNKKIFGRAPGLIAGSEDQSRVIEDLTQLITEFLKEEEVSFKSIADYDEWDYTLSGYRPDWVRVREIAMQPSTAAFVKGTLAQYHGLVSSLKRYFAMLRPDRLRRFPRQEDGDQEDLDAMVEAWVGKKRGVAVSGGFYVRRDKRVRDVAVAFLVDLSDSTNQKLESGKTILDIEKESVVIMAEALEALGDRYSIYGFNSEGRERVNFYIVKEFYEDYNLEVKQRFGGLKSAGQTRLGAAVRHAARKLEKIEASVRLLFLLSDGRPYDEDYCTVLDQTDFDAWLKHDELLYAQEDSRMSMMEAKMKLITPFCITVDHKGKEYLEKILGSVGYVVIDNVELLPVKLPEIYKRLTV